MIESRSKLPSLELLFALDAFSRHGNVTAAASELNLTQSAVSRQLQKLEAALGVPIFQRDARALELTADGRQYLDDIRPALDAIVNAGLRLRLDPNLNRLNLGVLPSFGTRWLMPKLPEFTRLYPEITLNLTTNLTFDDDDVSAFDAFFQFGEPPFHKHNHLLVKNERMIAVCATDLFDPAWQDGGANTIGTSGIPFLQLKSRPNAWSEWFTQKSLDPPNSWNGMVLDQFSTVYQAAISGLGFALMPQYLVEEPIATGRLVALHGKSIETKGAYYLTWNSALPAPPPLERFREWITQYIEVEDRIPR